MHNWTEFETQISLNDVIGGLSDHDKILGQFGVKRLHTGTDDGAAQLASGVVSRETFGFLAGIGPDWKQLWIFAVCTYFTGMALFIHCCPMVIRRSSVGRAVGLTYRRYRSRPETSGNVERSSTQAQTGGTLFRYSPCLQINNSSGETA